MKGSSYRCDSRVSSDMCVPGGHESSLSPSGVSHSCPQCGLGPDFLSKSPCLDCLSSVSLFLVVFFSPSVVLLPVFFSPHDCLLSALLHFISFHPLPTWKRFCSTHFASFLILRWLVYYWPSCMCRFVHRENKLVKGMMQYAINKYSPSEIIYSRGC